MVYVTLCLLFAFFWRCEVVIFTDPLGIRHLDGWCLKRSTVPEVDEAAFEDFEGYSSHLGQARSKLTKVSCKFFSDIDP
jgi:hypothetical protein